MTHIAWVPPEWLEAAERTLEGLGGAPSVAHGDPRADARTSPTGSTRGSRCAASRSATARSASEVIELTLRGDRVARARVDRAAARDLRPAGVPALARRAAVRRDAVGAARRRRRPGDRRLVGVGRAPLPRARGRLRADRRLRHRVGAHRRLADRAGRPLAGDRDAGDRRPRPARRGGAASRLARLAARPRRSLRSSRPASSASASTARRSCRATSRTATPSDLLSAELDKLARDHVYEEAVFAQGALRRPEQASRLVAVAGQRAVNRAASTAACVDAGVGRERTTSPGAGRAAVEGRAAAAGLLDDQLDRGVVPELELLVGRDVERALGDEAVLPEVAEARG